MTKEYLSKCPICSGKNKNCNTCLGEGLIPMERANEIRTALSQQDGVMVQAVLESGAYAIRAAFMLNGGSAVAILAFYGNAIPHLSIGQQNFLGWALVLFGLGVLAAGGASGFRFLSQDRYTKSFQNRLMCISDDKDRKNGDKWKKWSIFFATVSFIIFLIGLGVASAVLFHSNCSPVG